MRLSRGDFASALAVIVIWGLNFVVMKFGLQGLSPMLMGALRFAVASLPFLPFVKRPHLPRRLIVVYGLAQGLGQFGLLFLAIHMGMTAGVASVVMQMQAFFTLLLAVPLLGERARPDQWAGLAVAATGLLLIALAHGDGPQQMTLIGFVLTVGAAFMWASSNIVIRVAGRAGRTYDPFAFIVWTSAVPVLPFLALATLADGPASVLASLAAIGWRESAAVAYLGLLATLLAYTLWTRLLKRHPTHRVAPFSLLVPVVGLWAAAVVLGERPSPLQWWGTAAVWLGLLINQFGSRLVTWLKRLANGSERAATG